MPGVDRQRVDWMPGDAALQALDAAQLLRPELRRQELIDALVIAGLWALQLRPPPLHGNDRDRWKLPEVLRRP